MTMIDVDTSPLQAAREWRGIGLVAAAMTSGLPMAQAEALEEGDPSAFATIDEMIAAAVVYGASLGIGRDEAMALLDRTVTRTGAVQVELPDVVEPAVAAERPNSIFSGAVAERSARIADRDYISSEPLLAEYPSVDELEAHPVLDPIVEEPVAPAAELPQVPHGPTPEQAVAASGEIHLDDAFGPEAPWERSSNTGELEAWADDFRDDDLGLDGEGPVIARRGAGAGVGTKFVDGTHALVERLVGTERADATARWMGDTGERIGELMRDGREKLRRSEHATLIVAIGGGAILIAILVALGGALGGDDKAAGPGPADRASSEVLTTDSTPATGTATKSTKATSTKAPKADTKAAPMIPPARLTVDVFNAGSKKGFAKEVAAQFQSAGYKIGEVTNAKNSYPSAAVIHPKGMEREARIVAKRAGITTIQAAPGSSTSRHITVIVM